MLNNIFKGIQAYTGVFKLISDLKLWKYFMIPMIISFVTAIVIGISAYGFSDNIGQYIAKVWIWDFGRDTFTTLSNIIGGIIILAIGLILYKHIIMAFSAPFMSPVSEKIEAHYTGRINQEYRKTSFSQQLSRGIRLNIRNLGMELLLTIPLLLLKFIPFVNVFSTALLFLLQAYYAGFGNMDYTLERHYRYRESIQFVRRRRGLAMGNGIVFLGILLIPVIGFILVLPLSVTAASSETIKAIQNEKNQLPQH
mgnify:CR=1 FL=1